MDIKKRIQKEFAHEIGKLDEVVFDQDIITLSPVWKALSDRFDSNEVTADSKIDHSNDFLCVLFSNVRSKLNNMAYFVSEELSIDSFAEKLNSFSTENNEDAETTFAELLDEIGKRNSTNLIGDLESLGLTETLSTKEIPIDNTTILSKWGLEELTKSITDADLDFDALMELEQVTNNTLEHFSLDSEGEDLLSGLQDIASNLES